MKPVTAAILTFGIVMVALIWASTQLISGPPGAYQAIRVEPGKPLLYVLDTNAGTMRLCGTEACVIIRDTNPSKPAAQ